MEQKENQETFAETTELNEEENRDSTSPVETEKDLEALLEEKDEELKNCQEKVLRVAAELENFKKRIEREKKDHMKFALESFAKELLPFLDNLERAIEAAKDTGDIEKLVEGVEISLTSYFKVIEKFGMKTFDSLGQPFDPERHEALTVEPNDEEIGRAHV